MTVTIFDAMRALGESCEGMVQALWDKKQWDDRVDFGLFLREWTQFVSDLAQFRNEPVFVSNRPVQRQKGKKEPWFVFKSPDGEELCSITVFGSFPGEVNDTKGLLAYEHGLRPEDITCEVINR